MCTHNQCFEENNKNINIFPMKVEVSNDQEKAQSEKDFHSKNRSRRENTKPTIRRLYRENISYSE